MSDVNIIGLSDVINNKHVKPGIDPHDVENKFRSGGHRTTRNPTPSEKSDPIRNFSDDVDELLRDYNLGDITSRRGGKKRNRDSDSDSDASDYDSDASGSDASGYGSGYGSGSDASGYGSGYGSGNDASGYGSGYGSGSGSSRRSRRSSSSRRQFINPGSRLDQYTIEQSRRGHINGVLNSWEQQQGNSGVVFSLEKEKEEDTKNQWLSEIENLRETLEADGVDLSRIPIVDNKSSLDDIRSVRNALHRKNNTKRYASWAEDIILLVVKGMEHVFDGKKEYFGFSPDLSDWNTTVAAKLRRMRPNTTQMVSSIVQHTGISPFTQLMFELVPSAFMQSYMNKKTHGEKGLYSSMQTSVAINDLRDDGDNDW